MSYRNVLFIIADDWSPIARCYGDTLVHTPRIDAVAEAGTVFEQAFCTTPSCGASRASILTGQHSHTHGQYGHAHGCHGFRTHEHMPTLPRILGDAGVHCQLIGKHHTAPDAVYPWAHRTGNLHTPDAFRQATRDALAHDQPAFVMVAPLWPHRMYDASGYGLTDHRDAFDDVTYDPADVPVPGFLPDLPEVRQDLAHYYAAITRYDQCVGAALDALDASGKADETLVVITSDHAMPFPGAKASCYDTGHRCPLIVRRPGQARQVRSQALVNWLDFAPTLYDWFEVTPPSEPLPLPGRSLLPVLDEAEPAGWEQTTFSHNFHEVTMYDPYRVLRGRRYKFVQRLAHRLPMPLPSDLFASPTWEAVRRGNVSALGQRHIGQYTDRPLEALYDIEQDPMETRSLIDVAEHAETVERMRRDLMRMRIASRDPWLMLDHQRDPASMPIEHVQL